MATRLTQALINRAPAEHDTGTQLYDAEVSGLRVVVGKRSCSYKFMGRINDGTVRYISVALGRADDVSLRPARERATELRLALRRGEDPRRPRLAVPNVEQAMERYLAGRQDLSPRTVLWYHPMVDGPLSSLRKLPMDKIDREHVRSLHERLTRKNGAYRSFVSAKPLPSCQVLPDSARPSPIE